MCGNCSLSVIVLMRYDESSFKVVQRWVLSVIPCYRSNLAFVVVVVVVIIIIIIEMLLMPFKLFFFYTFKTYMRWP